MALAAYHLGHRLSDDIDLFCPEEALIPIVARKLTPALEQEGIAVAVTRSFGSFWEAVLREGNNEIRLQLALDAPFRLQELAEKDGLFVHSLADIAAGKLLALFTRAAARDFIDVYWLVRDGHFTIDQLVALAKEKDPGVDFYYLAIAFRQVDTLPDDIAGLRLALREDVDLAALKTFFREQAVRLLDEHLQ